MMKNGATPDLNGDGVVTELDLHQLHDIIKNGESPSGADLNGDGRVDGKDTACIATLIGSGKSQGSEKENRDNKEKTDGIHACLPPVTSQERLFVYDEHRLLGEYDIAGNPIQETVWLGNLPVATVQNGKLYYIHTDHLGTPRVITDNSNTEIWKWESDPFGVAAANDDPDGDGVGFTFNLRFPGQYFDAETGLHYNYFRDYDPSTGRYIQSDPIGLAGGLNTYGYVGQNPLSWADHRGLRASKSRELYDVLRLALETTLTEYGPDWLDMYDRRQQREIRELYSELRRNQDYLSAYNENGLQRERMDQEMDCERLYGGDCPKPVELKRCIDDVWADYFRTENLYVDRNLQILDLLNDLGIR
jgi:RHS repeat-associated protein